MWLPMINRGAVGSQAGVLGTVLFNFGFVTTVPSWVNEKRMDVSVCRRTPSAHSPPTTRTRILNQTPARRQVNKTVWIATACCNLIFFAVGITGAMAFAPYLAGPATNACAAVRPACKRPRGLGVVHSDARLPIALLPLGD